jgi:hypothetical protein
LRRVHTPAPWGGINGKTPGCKPVLYICIYGSKRPFCFNVNRNKTKKSKNTGLALMGRFFRYTGPAPYRVNPAELLRFRPRRGQFFIRGGERKTCRQWGIFYRHGEGRVLGPRTPGCLQISSPPPQKRRRRRRAPAGAQGGPKKCDHLREDARKVAPPPGSSLCFAEPEHC